MTDSKRDAALHGLPCDGPTLTPAGLAIPCEPGCPTCTAMVEETPC